MPAIERRFLAVDGRVVHYRSIGAGPPVVMLHASPANSTMVLGEMQAAAPYFTCIAFDMPGFGLSDPLPGDPLTVRDLAAATAAAMAAMGLPPCPVFGTHTGASIALELGAGWPERVSGVVLDAVPSFSEEEMAFIFEDFFVSFEADPLGAHLTRIWMRFRDQFTWFPWHRRLVSRLNPVDRPGPADIQHWVMMYNDARKAYIPAYRAACYYGRGAWHAAARLTLPAIFMATEEDMLFGHLDRLPPPKAGQRIVRLPYDAAAKQAAIVDFLRAMPAGAAAPPPPPPRPVGQDPARQFIDTDFGQILVRCYGDPRQPAVILLHDAPGTGLALAAEARQLAAHAYVILPDLPGTGESSAADPDLDILEVSAAGVTAIIDALGLTRCIIAAIGCGAAVAAWFAGGDDQRVGALLLERPPTPDAAIAAAIAPDLPLTPEGSHWLQAWLMLRDAQIYRPWFDGRRSAQRQSQGNFDADWLHDQTVALMKSRESYHRLPRAAYSADTPRRLAHSRVPVQLAEEGQLPALILATLRPAPPDPGNDHD